MGRGRPGRALLSFPSCALGWKSQILRDPCRWRGWGTPDCVRTDKCPEKPPECVWSSGIEEDRVPGKLWAPRRQRVTRPDDLCGLHRVGVGRGRERRDSGEYLLVKSIPPFGSQDNQFQSRLDYLVAFLIKPQFQSHVHVGDPRERWVLQTRRGKGRDPPPRLGLPPRGSLSWGFWLLFVSSPFGDFWFVCLFFFSV